VTGTAARANAQRNPSAGTAQPASAGPSVKPRSPQNRNMPTAVPEARAGATSEGIAPGGTPAAPDATPSTASATPSSSPVGAQPTAAVVTASPASAGTSTGLRPRRSAALPAGYSTTNSVPSATANTTPMPTVDRPRASWANSGTRVSNTTATIHR
jgi:hypothetical protein